MKPEMPLQSFNYEQPSVTGEVVGGKNIEKNIDSGVDKRAERYERHSDMSAIANDVMSTTMLPTPVVGDHNDDNITTVLGNAPLIANDDDLIEKEWVDKAKRIITDTHNNPHQREHAVSELQLVYLKKRYGKELGVTE